MNDDDFMTPLAQGATAVKELYDAYVSAGFTEQQALRIVIAVLRSART